MPSASGNTAASDISTVMVAAGIVERLVPGPPERPGPSCPRLVGERSAGGSVVGAFGDRRRTSGGVIGAFGNVLAVFCVERNASGGVIGAIDTAAPSSSTKVARHGSTQEQ